MVSGGNAANFTAYLAAKTAKVGKTITTDDPDDPTEKFIVYCSKACHTWIEKASVLFGQGSESIR